MSAQAWRVRGLAACLFLVVVGARWATIERSGSDLPEWDQWDAEGAAMLVPWYQHRMSPGVFLEAHNEHRLVLTRLANFSLTVSTGQWDQRAQATLNALLPGIIAASLLVFGLRRMPRGCEAPWFLLLCAAFALPLAWQNVLGGLHSLQFFLVGLSLAAITLLPFRRPGSVPWLVGAAAAVLALGSMASGFFASVVVAVLVALRLRQRAIRPAAAWPTFILCAALVAVGLATRVEVPGHEVLMAHGMGDFFLSLARNLRWPAGGNGAWAILLWSPTLWLAARLRRATPGEETDNGLAILGLSAWVLLQILATAYARGAGGAEPAVRYLDTLFLGMVANGLALGWLWKQAGEFPAARRPLALLAFAWAAVFAIGTAEATASVLSVNLPWLQRLHRYSEHNAHNFVATGDEWFLRHDEEAYPDHSLLAARLKLPELRAILPVSVREPIALAGGPAEGFVREPPAGRYGDAGPGFPPGTPGLPGQVSWSSFRTTATPRPARWTSLPVAPPGPGWLVFQMAGYPTAPGQSLELASARDGRHLASVRPDRDPGAGWRSAYVRIPSEPFVVRAVSEGAGAWFGFSEPAWMSRASHAAWSCVRAGSSLVFAGLAGALLIGLAGLMARRRGPAVP
jgi:hypothetical protein